MAKNNQRDPSLRARTVARVNQFVKSGLTKAGAFEKISAETGRAKDAVQMLYYRAIRAAKGAPRPAAPRPAAPKPAARTTATKAAPRAASVATPRPAAPAPAPKTRSRRRPRSRTRARGGAARSLGVAQSGEFPGLLNGIASAINALLKHVEKTVQENKTLKKQSQRLQAITSLIRGR